MAMAMVSRKVYEGNAILADFEQLLETSPSCPCSSPALRRVVWAYKMVDILRLARRFRDPVILAVEYRQQGSRLFMAASRRHVFHHLCHLRLCRPELRTWHEIFSGLTPLRLYFDLDFFYETNPRVDANRLLSQFRRLVLEVLTDHFQWCNGQQRNLRFVDLDATTPEKFSRHIILRMINPNDGTEEILFKNSMEIREFVHTRLLPRLKSDGLFVQPKLGQRQDDPEGCPLVDLSVYTEKPGQNFRLLGSPKFGRENFLQFLHATGHEFRFHDPQCVNCEQIFFDSLVTAPSSATRQRQNQSAANGISAEPQLMSAKNFEIYRSDVRSACLDSEIFGVRCAFYYETDHFGLLSRLFYNKIAKDLLKDVGEASRKSEFYEDSLDYERLKQCILLFVDFKRAMSRDPVDWDSIYGYAADILDFFQSGLQNDDFDQSVEEELGSGLEADPNTIRRLRVLYAKFSKWRQESPSDFFVQDFERAKKMYDSYLETLASSRKAILPDHFPLKLTRQNFAGVYDFLEHVELVELERRKMKKERYEQRFLLKAQKLRQCLEEEEKFRRWMENRSVEYQRKNTAFGEAPQRAVHLAIAHSWELTEDYEKRIKIYEAGGAEASAAVGATSGEVGASLATSAVATEFQGPVAYVGTVVVLE